MLVTEQQLLVYDLVELRNTDRLLQVVTPTHYVMKLLAYHFSLTA